MTQSEKVFNGTDVPLKTFSHNLGHSVPYFFEKQKHHQHKNITFFKSVISGNCNFVYLCVCLHSKRKTVKGKQLELSKANLVHKYSVAVT